ncbi:MAG: tetratricopeptide repeat protein [Bacteroidetes bacterium]|nr:tetratricopeptide repeat protein [Bacteroidota bacterium]
MNRSGFLLTPILLGLFLTGCNESTYKTAAAGTQSKQAVMEDSLQKLDSLVFQYRAKNTGESMKYARQADKIARAINTPEAREKAYNILGNASSAISIDSGFYYYQKAVMVIDSFNLADKKGKVLYNLGMLNRSAGNFRNYLVLMDSALRCAIKVNDYATQSNSLNSLGTFYSNIGEKATARKLFDSAFAVANSKLLYLQMGSALGNLARFEADGKKSLALSRRAISYLEKCSGSGEPIALILLNIGYRFPDPDSSLHYNNLAINLVSAEFAPEVVMGAYNNMAYCYLWKGDLANAEKCMTEHALPIAIKTHNIDWQSTVYDTYADVLTRKGNSAEALAYKTKAIEAKKTFRATILASLDGLPKK